MILYFLDRDMQVLGVASTHQPGTHHITDDRMTDELSASVKTLEFDLVYRFAERQNADLCTTPGNCILRERDGAYSEFMIVDSEEDTEKNRINVYAEDAGMGLINRTIGRFVPSGPSKIADYIGTWLEGTGFEIGVNEIPNVEKYVYWTSEDRATDRICECAKKFGAEIEYSFEIDRLRIAHKYLNIYARRGPVTYRTLRVGIEIGGITKARSSADVVTGITPNGNTDEEMTTPSRCPDMHTTMGNTTSLTGRSFLARLMLSGAGVTRGISSSRSTTMQTHSRGSSTLPLQTLGSAPISRLHGLRSSTAFRRG